jgi:O-antigen ligase
MQRDDSIQDRIYPAIRAWEMFLDAPVAGKGVGVTSRRSLGDGTHNMYLLLMAEQGFVGLLMYLSLIGLLANRGWRLAREAPSAGGKDLGKAIVLYAAFIASYGFFSHNVLEEPHGIFLMAFLAAAGFQATAEQGHRPWLARGYGMNIRPASRLAGRIQQGSRQ